MSVHHYERFQDGYKCLRCKDTIPLTKHDAAQARKRRLAFEKAQSQADRARRR